MPLSVPYHHDLATQPEPGAFFTVKGVVQSNAHIAINLAADHNNSAIPLHVSVRPGDGHVCLNSFKDSDWQKEERFNHKVKIGEKLDVRVMTTSDKFMVYVSRKHVADMDYRMVLGDVKCLFVDGPVTLNQVSVTNQQLAMPYEQKLPGGGSVQVTGLTDKDQFVINMRDANNDILLHLNTRLKDKVIVRNTQRNGQWDTEEREGGLSGMEKSAIFDIVIKDDPDKFQIIVNDEPYASFGKRWQKPVASMDISGDLDRLFYVQHHNQ